MNNPVKPPDNQKIELPTNRVILKAREIILPKNDAPILREQRLQPTARLNIFHRVAKQLNNFALLEQEIYYLVINLKCSPRTDAGAVETAQIRDDAHA